MGDCNTIICWAQTILYILYLFNVLVTLKIFKKQKTALIAGFIYATYPFIIVWNPAYADTIFLVICALIFFYKSIEKNLYNLFSNYWYNLALAGLTRPHYPSGILCLFYYFIAKIIVNLRIVL